MLSDEQVMREVRDALERELASLNPPEDLLERLRSRSAHERHRGARWRGRADRRSHVGARAMIPVALGGLVAIAIAVLALTSLSGSRRPSDVPAAPGSSLQALIDEFGVLRQPQTAAARAYNARLLKRDGVLKGRLVGPGQGLIPGLTRLVRFPDSARARVFLYVEGYRSPSRTHGRTHLGPLKYGLGFTELFPGQGVGACCQSARELRTRLGLEFDEFYQSGQHPKSYYFEIVPDGVARVRWVFPRQPTYANERGFFPPFARTLVITVPVHHNVAAITLPQRGDAAHVIWYSQSGRVLATAKLGR
jgi:hypothetical protein